MPYSVKDGELRTPGGCKVDQGRAISSIRWEKTGVWLEMTFRDGSLYHLRTSSLSELISLLTDRPDPGCVVNALVRDGTMGLMTKGRWKGRRNIGIKMIALPPKYLPIPEP